jgi:chaperonin GroES
MSNVKIRPIGDRMVVKQAAVVEKTESGIFIPATASSVEPLRGEVLAVGEGRRALTGQIIPMAVNVGDNILFHHRVGQVITVAGEQYTLLCEADVLGILNQ